MKPPVIPPLGNVPDKPDKDTQKGLRDFTSREADKRVLFIDIGFLKYGTDDKAHAASIILSALLFIALVADGIAGFAVTNQDWAKNLFTWLGSAFLFVSGVAIGKSGSGHGRSDD